MENRICRHITGNLKKNILYDYRYPGTNGGLNIIEFNKLMSNCRKLVQNGSALWTWQHIILCSYVVLYPLFFYKSKDYIFYKINTFKFFEIKIKLNVSNHSCI